MVTKVSSNLRATISMRNFALLSDELATIVERKRIIEAEMAGLLTDVLNDIGTGRPATVNKKIRYFSPESETKTKRIAAESEVVEYCKEHGIEFNTRSEEWIAPATFGKYVRQGLMPEEFYEQTVVRSVVVK